MQAFEKKTRIEAPAGEVFRWHARPGALERLTPPWERVRIVEKTGGIEDVGSRVVLETRLGPLRQRWVAEHVACEEGRSFRDRQVSGPFAHWDHTHRFEPLHAGASTLHDRVEYTLPGGALGRWFGGGFVERKLERLFAYRHATTAADLEAHRAPEAGDPLRIHVSGSRGLVGSTLVPFLSTGGHDVRAIERRSGWEILLEGLEGADAVVHLAGENLADGRWTRAKKERVRASRVEGTRRIAEHLAGMANPPKVFACASAVGFYGHRGDEELNEGSAPGEGFLAELCRDWETATEAARRAGIRVVSLRIGVVLSPRGGALAKMLPPSRAGLGGPLGGGRQYVPWISVDDVAGAILHCLRDERLAGPVNLVAPEPVRQGELARLLGKVLRRPAFLPLPAFAARLRFGELADALLLTSARVRPGRLLECGYAFRDRDPEQALRRLLGRVG